MLLTIVIVGAVLLLAIAAIKLLWPSAERRHGAPTRTADAAASADEIRQLARRGRKIEAIKLYRDLHGTGLREAKEAVEKLASE